MGKKEEERQAGVFPGESDPELIKGQEVPTLKEKLAARGWKVVDEEETTVAFVGEAVPEDGSEDS
jgi:hypothetical protein